MQNFYFRDVAMVIATSTEIEKALRNTSFDRNKGFETTPMRKLIMKMPGILYMLTKFHNSIHYNYGCTIYGRCT